MSAPMTDIRIERLGTTRDRLGENPIWDEANGLLWWVDAYGPTIRCLDPRSGRRQDREAPGKIGCMALRAAGGLVLGLQDGIYILSLDDERFTRIHEARFSHPDLRYNDGKVDRQGRFVLGTVQIPLPAQPPYAGHLCTLDTARAVILREHDIGVCNGPCFSPDGTTFYLADSARLTISAYDYDPASGAMTNKRPFIDTAPLGGRPDGATVDAQGFLWTAFVNTGQIVRFDPAGRMVGAIDMPAAHPSSITFGGPACDTLFVTSISDAGRHKANGPDDGGVFAITGLGVTGIRETPFAG